MWFEYFQDGCHGGHLGYQNGTILSSSKSLCCPDAFHQVPLHPTYCSGADNNWRLSRWPPWLPSWIRFWWRCLKCEKLLTDIMSPKCLPPSFSSIRLTVREQMSHDFQDGHHGGHLGYWNEFSNSKSPSHPNASHQL